MSIQYVDDRCQLLGQHICVNVKSMCTAQKENLKVTFRNIFWITV